MPRWTLSILLLALASCQKPAAIEPAAAAEAAENVVFDPAHGPVREASELRAIHRVAPVHPRGGPKQVACQAKVAIACGGDVAMVDVTGCPEPFRRATSEALWQWRWEPPVDEAGREIAVQTLIPVTFRLADRR